MLPSFASKSTISLFIVVVYFFRLSIFSPAFKPVDLILQIRKEPASVRAVHLRVVELKRHAQQIL
jgi:hypothetical protein